MSHLLFLLTSYWLNMFRTLIYPSSGAYEYSAELPHWSCVTGSMCVGVSVWLGWKDTVPNLQEAGLAPGTVWIGGKSRPHRDSIPDRPAS